MGKSSFYCLDCGEGFKYMNDLDEVGFCSTCHRDAADITEFDSCSLCATIDLLDACGFCGQCANLSQEGREYLNPEYAAVEAASKEEDKEVIDKKTAKKILRTIGFCPSNTTKGNKKGVSVTPKKTNPPKIGGYVTQQGSSTTYPASQGYTYKKPCDHPGTTTLFRIKHRFFSAANTFGVKEAIKSGVKAVIDLAGVAPTGGAGFVGSGAPKKYDALRPAQTYEYIRLHWNDMGVAPVGREFWIKLVDLLPKGRVSVNCVGGHGRTGTCLAALLICHNRMTAGEAIDFIHEKHCSRAIETASQEKYLELLQTEAQRDKDIKYLNDAYPGWLDRKIKKDNHHYGWKNWPGYKKEKTA